MQSEKNKEKTKGSGLFVCLYPPPPRSSMSPDPFDSSHLDELGLPTVNASKITVEGQPALLFDRFAQGSKDVVKLSGGQIRTVGSSSLLNARSAADLRAIRKTMLEKNIKIDDLQFLIGRDGKVVIADPLDVTSGAPSRNNLQMIDLLIQAAEKK